MWRSTKNRIRRLFGQKATVEGIVSEDDAQRELVGIHAGDQITVVETHGAWMRVETADGSKGWVYWLPTA